MLVLCRIARLDPYLKVAAILGVLGSVAIFALEIMCAVAIFVYFRRTKDRRLWTTALSPIVAGVSLAAFLAIVLVNFAGLTGSTSSIVDLVTAPLRGGRRGRMGRRRKAARLRRSRGRRGTARPSTIYNHRERRADSRRHENEEAPRAQ